MQAQNDLAVSSHWWHCGGHKDLQGLRSEKSRYFSQPDLSKKSSSSFLGCCGAHLASSVKEKQGWPRLRQPGLASCATLLSSIQRAGNERGSEQQGEAGRQESGGERGRIDL